MRLLEDKVEGSVGFLMKIECGLLFEEGFYEEGKEGEVGGEGLNEVMVEGEKEGFGE